MNARPADAAQRVKVLSETAKRMTNMRPILVALRKVLDPVAVIFRVTGAVTLPADLFVVRARAPPASATASTG